jgi:hypothetical protein
MFPIYRSTLFVSSIPVVVLLSSTDADSPTNYKSKKYFKHSYLFYTLACENGTRRKKKKHVCLAAAGMAGCRLKISEHSALK